MGKQLVVWALGPLGMQGLDHPGIRVLNFLGSACRLLAVSCDEVSSTILRS